MRTWRFAVALIGFVFVSSAGAARAEVEAFRAAILYFTDDPAPNDRPAAYQYWDDGLLVVEHGKVKRAGPAPELLKSLPKGAQVTSYPDALIVPGFIDAHVHYPQTEMIASYGEHLLEWLNKYTFPTEAKFKDEAHAREVARIFLKELLRNGTTTALVFATVHKSSVDALFEEALILNLRLIAGKVLMDRNAPADLLDTPESAYTDSKELIKKWRGKGRLLYAVTPRFAPTSSEQELIAAKRLIKEFPDVYLQTHLSENEKEIDWVKSLFPSNRDYTDVYDHYGLLGGKSVFAHSIHLSDAEWDRLAATESSVVFCPSSNLFLGSGLFNLKKAQDRHVRVALGSDVGAGTSFSMLQNLNEAYKVLQLQGQTLSPFEGFYLATLGGAKALSLDGKIGNFQPGREADFVVLDLKATPLLAYRMEMAKTLAERLFLLMTLGDDRAVEATYVFGRPAYARGG